MAEQDLPIPEPKPIDEQKWLRLRDLAERAVLRGPPIPGHRAVPEQPVLPQPRRGPVVLLAPPSADPRWSGLVVPVVGSDPRRMKPVDTAPRVVVVRVYDEPPEPGAHRVLVDRLWPRGVTKVAAALDEWSADVAPTTELRRWYGHDPAKFAEFARRYRAELVRPPASNAVSRLLDIATTRRVALVTATRDVEHSGAQVLHDHLIHTPWAER